MRSRVALMTALWLSGAIGCAGHAPTTPMASTPVAHATDEARLSIKGVGVEPKTLDVSGSNSATIRYTLSREADVTIDLVDEDGRVARRLEPGRQAAGRQTVAWDGRDAEGQLIPTGVYRYVIHARSMEDGRSTMDETYDPSRETGGEQLTARDFTYDEATNRMRWVMPRAGFARMRVGIQGFPHLATLLDWQPMEAGAQELTWDGFDASGLVDLKQHPARTIQLAAFALPDNTIIIRNSNAAATQGAAEASTSSYPRIEQMQAAYLHAKHPRASCHDARIQVEFPGVERWDDQARPILTRGVIPVRVTIDPADAPRFINARFELALYEDLTILFEEEEATTPFTFTWDTSRLPAGQHLLTVNVLGYDDHFGVATQPIMLEQPS